jgi:beta-lactamase class A
MRKVFQSSWFQSLVLVLVFASGFLVKSLFFETIPLPKIENLRKQGNDYKYIDPLLLCRVVGLPPSPQYTNLKAQINSKISSSGDQIQKVSVVFRNLEEGHGFNINENDKYAPASLLKLPLMVAYLKAFESNPSLLEKKLAISDGTNLAEKQNYQPLESVKPGQAYSIQELLNYMIMYSDNNAAALLDNYLEPELKNTVYGDLDLTIPPESMTVEFMSARLYSYFFRILFNATYLSPELSEQAMELLIQAHFPDGIEGGVPKNTPIAQKFGERLVKAGNDTNSPTLYNELHSCGIIFYPEHPYLLCIMTKGNNFTNLSQLIQSISKTVYEEVDKEYSKQ